MAPHPFGWLSVLPPLIAIVLAIATRRVTLSLLAGVATGAGLLASQQVAPSNFLDWTSLTITELLEGHLWKAITDEGHLRVFAFTLLMGAMVGVIYRSGGMHGLVAALTPLARGRRGGQFITWLLGLLVFFDDYANTLLLGHTMRPLTDRLKISREKLAYVVDSTAAPVSGLALVSTWVATEIQFIGEGMSGLEWSTSNVEAMSVFLASVPYRFYVLWALFFVPLVALAGRDFGPMLTAERKALAAGDHDEEPQKTDGSEKTDSGHWLLAVAPVGAMLAIVVWLLVETGTAAIEQEPQTERTWLNIFGRADSYIALLYGAAAGLAIATATAVAARRLSLARSQAAALRGALHVLPALSILWLAWTLSAMTDNDHLQTGEFVAGLLRERVSAAWMPTMVFLLASITAFATGTSWGTMGILMPLAIRATHGVMSQGGPVDPFDPIVLGAVGGVLAGAIFGDHCSPISDTTVLSSHASGCDHVAHVRTQLPYAVVVGAVATLGGALLVGMGLSVWICQFVGPAAMVAILYMAGRRAE